MTKDQERARAKRRYERQQANLAAQQAAQKRNLQVAAVVAAVIAVVAAFLLLSKVMGDTNEQPSAGATGNSASASGSGSASDAPVAAGCDAAPAAPGTGGELDAPDAAAIKAVEGKTVVASLATNCGAIELTLDGAKAPKTVASFVQLAQQGYWKDAPCHRLTTAGIYVLQCGDPTGSGSGGPGYGYGIENAPADGKYPAGTVAMARTQDPNSNGGQYFIVYQDSELPTDGGGYTIFGTVTAGMDIVDKIAAGGVADGGSDGALKFPISTLTVTTETKG